MCIVRDQIDNKDILNIAVIPHVLPNIDILTLEVMHIEGN